MIDTIKLFYLTEDSAHLSELLTNTRCSIDPITGEVTSTQGNHGNLRVTIYPNAVKIENSLAKYWNGNNVESFSQNAIANAIERLSDELSLPLHRASIRRVDAGVVAPISQPLKVYRDLLGSCPRHDRRPSGSGIQYINGQNAISIYDPRDKLLKDKQPIPECIAEMFVVRFELQCRKKITAQFGRPLFGRDLSNERFLEDCRNKLKRSLKSIKPEREIENFSPFLYAKGCKDLQKLGILNSLFVVGGISKAQDQLRLSRNSGTITLQQYNAMLRLIRLIANIDDITKSYDAITEIQTAITRAIDDYDLY